jgi:hypothetical protein
VSFNICTNFTPEILINGHSFPKEYDRADLVYFVEDLYESCNQVTKKNTNTSIEQNA